MSIASFAFDIIDDFAILNSHAFQLVRTKVVTDIAMFDSGTTGFDGFTILKDNLHYLTLNLGIPTYLSIGMKQTYPTHNPRAGL
jgi:hypothetical protein